MPDRRRLPLTALRLRRAARAGAPPDRRRGPRRPPVHGAGGARHRTPEQAARVRASGERPGHRGGEPGARLPRGRAGVGNRQPDPRRPRVVDDPDSHEQPEEDQRARGLRPDGHRAGADRGAAERREPPLPRDEAREARAPAPPPGSALRPGAARVSERVEGIWDEEQFASLEEQEELEEPVAEALPEEAEEPEPDLPSEEDELPRLRSAEHGAGELEIPLGYNVLTGRPTGGRRTIAVAISCFNGAITNRLLDSALRELEHAGVAREAVTVMPVPGAFELP